MDREEARLLRDKPGALERATPLQLVRLPLTFARQERFCDGATLGFYGSGLLLGFFCPLPPGSFESAPLRTEPRCPYRWPGLSSGPAFRTSSSSFSEALLVNGWRLAGTGAGAPPGSTASAPAGSLHPTAGP
ncbi:DUF6508 domain-containing protein [Deinococcus hopiensis]|uniref:DUF6508 domain-containing protein n=1 Tax=Deinococcus hopiensis TaxID=309885 RepID=UPI001FE2A70B|nr:DUF6508 domain-containing protein [Deinococcus hopiensis]